MMEDHGEATYLKSAVADIQPVDAVVVLLQERIEELHRVGNRLEGRLSPILTPNPETAEAEGRPMQQVHNPEAPLVESLAKLADSVSSVERHLEWLIGRLAV